jgi:hypothetical protein
MPATSIRDLVIKGNDLVVATHGRSFWIMDDITALRNLVKIKDASQTTLYQTGQFYRVRWNMNTDTPLPQEEPAGQNPPDGAIIDYYLKDNAKAVTNLEILDATGKLVRVYKSDDKPYDVPPVNIPLYWIRPQQILPTEKGSHRFIWDLHTQPLDLPPGYPIAAIYGQTAPVPTSPWVMPGNYTIKLTVDGKSYTQPLTIKIDPRVKTPLVELQRQYDLSDKCYRHLKTVMAAMEKLNSLREQINKLLPNASGELAVALKKTNADALKAENGTAGTKVENFNSLRSTLGGLMNLLQESEMPVTTQAAGAVNQADIYFNNLNLKYKELTGNNLKALNEQLARAGSGKISL